MKNLKKVLALGLALVMLLGMFTIASAAETEMVASDLTDWDTVAHKDAVSLMVDLGIIKGMPDGTFTPTGNIDRASWAKMVYFAATGSEDADAYLGTASGLGDIAGNWAESYISFLKANNYISGDNFGNYNPSDNVTVAEACKMMLTVLGYDAEDRGYQNNTAWSGNIMTDAKRNGLMDNVDSAQTALVPLTRENAAEIVLNALNANMVDAEMLRDNGEKYVHTYTKLYTLGYDVFNMVKITATVGGIDTNGYATFTAVTEPEDANTITTSNIDSKVKASANLVGEDVNVYVKTEGGKWDEKTGEILTTGTFKSVISSSAAKANTTPAKVITSGITQWGNLTVRGTSNFVATEFAKDDTGKDITAYYLNGAVSNETDVKAAAARRGTVVEFYTNTDGQIGTVKAYRYTVDQVENGDVTTKTLSDGTLQVRVPGVINSYTDADKVDGWQGLVDGDVVLYYKTSLDGSTSDVSYTIEKADKVTGKVSSFSSNGGLTINGSSYKGSEQIYAGSFGDVLFDDYDPSGTHTNDAQGIFGAWTSKVNSDLTTEYDFYLDKNGSIVAGIQLTESVDNSKVCMILEAEVGDSALGVSGNLRANLLFVDGSTEIVTISKVDKMSVVDKVTNAEKQISTDTAFTQLVGSKGKYAMTKFFAWKSTSTGYELTTLSAANDARNWETPASLGDGTAKVASIAKDGDFVRVLGTLGNTNKSLESAWAAAEPQKGAYISANANTTFIVGKRNANDDTVAYSVYKSFKNIPEMDATMITAICENTSTESSDVNTVAKYVYLETGAFKDDVPDGYIFIYDWVTSIDPELAEDDVYLAKIVDVNGQLDTMRIDWDLWNAITADKNNMTLNKSRSYVGHFFAIGEIDEDGVVSQLTNGEDPAAERAVTLGDLVALGDDVVKVSNGTTTESYSYDDATKFVFVDMGWKDGDTNTPEELNNRDEANDDISFSDAGTFSPTGFYNENDVSDKLNAEGKPTTTYKYVEAVVICPSNSNTADYVYVLRTLW